jgi:hypothetical protein
MAYDSLTTMNFSEGFHTIFVYLNNTTSGIFMPSLIFMLWACITIGSYHISFMRTGKGDFPQSMATSGFVMIILTTFLLMNVSGLINGTSATIIFSIGVLSIAWFLLSRE